MGTNERSLGDSHTPERSCILTRRKAEKDALIRLALAPDGSVHPDVRARAPGRGAYVGVTKAELEQALAKGQLKGALARAFKTGEVEVDAALPDSIEAALRQQLLDRLGLEARGGMLVTGAEKCETSCRKGEAMLLLHAEDASADGISTLAQAWRVGEGPERTGSPAGLVLALDRPTLSTALGRGNVVHIALTDGRAAKRVKHALTRWQAFIGPRAGLDGGKPAVSASAQDLNTKD